MDSFKHSIYTPVPENTALVMMESEQYQYGVNSISTALNTNTVISNSTFISIDSAAEIPNSITANNPYVNNNNFTISWQQQQYMRQMLLMGSQLPFQTTSNEDLLAPPQNNNAFNDMNGIQMYSPTISQQYGHQTNGLSPDIPIAPNHTHFQSNVDLQSLYYLDPNMNFQQQYGLYPGSFANSPTPFNYINSQHTNVPLINNIHSQVPQSSISQMYISNQTDAFHDYTNNNYFMSTSLEKINRSNPTMIDNLTSKSALSLNQINSNSNNNNNNQDIHNGYEKMISSPSIPSNQLINYVYDLQTTSKVDSSFTSNQQSSVSVTMAYIPKTRHIETYGGIDVKYFEKLEIKKAVPHFQELGAVDIGSLTMSLKSNMKMEVANALNVLTSITMLPYLLHLSRCEDLLDILLKRFENCISECFKQLKVDKKMDFNSRTETLTKNRDGIYSELFESSLLEMKSLIPSLEQSSSDTLLSLHEQVYCILNILRNLSFMQENIDYLANHHRFITVLVDTLKSIQIIQDSNYINRSIKYDFISSDNIIKDTDILNIKKGILIIFANISIAVTVLVKQKDSVEIILSFLSDFLINDSDTYYSLLAMEIWNKLLVHEDNRQSITNLFHLNIKQKKMNRLSNSIRQILLQIWKSLIRLFRNNFYVIETGLFNGISSEQLATLEMIMMGLYNVVAIADIFLCQTLIKEDDGIIMEILRMCTILAELNNKHLRIVTQRGLETIYVLVLGGGTKTAQLINHQRQYQRLDQDSKQNSLFPISYLDINDENIKYKQYIKYSTQKLFNQTILREKLMMIMLNPVSDPFIIAGLNDILSFVEEVIYAK